MKSTFFNVAIQRKRLFLGAATALAIFCALVINATAQQSQPAPPPASPSSSQAQPAPGSGKENLGPTADSIRPYRPYNRDPFKKPIKPKTPKDKAKQMALQLGYPMIEERRGLYRQQVAASREKGAAEPEPVTQ